MSSKEFSLLLQRYEPLIKAVVEVFHPFVEAAVHDLKAGKIVAIYHNISQRKVGEPSPLKELKVQVHEFPEYFAPYYKRNWDGRELKCTSITMRNAQGEPIGLLCINIDVSSFQNGFSILKDFLSIKDEAKNPVELHGGNGEEQTETFIQQYLNDKHLSLQYLSRTQKKELIQILYKKGVFNFKNAAPFIAAKLRMSRASVYNYIKQIVE